MAIAVGVTSKGRNTGSTSVANTGVTTQATGSTILVLAFWQNAQTFVSIADNKANTYTQIGTEITIGGTDRCRAYYCENAAGGAGHQVTVTVSGTCTNGLMFLEVTGGRTSGILDQNQGRDDTSSPFTLAAGLTTTQAAELLVTALVGNSGSNPATHAESGLGSSTIQTGTEETDGTNFYCSAISTKIVAATSTFNPSWTEAGGTAGATWLFTFKEAAGGAPATLSSPTPSGTIGTTTTATVGATSDQSTGTFYAVLSTTNNVATATATQIKAGQNSTGAAAAFASNTAVSNTSPNTAFSGLTAATLYFYAAAQNNANGDSNVVSGSFTTATASSATNQRFMLLGIS